MNQRLATLLRISFVILDILVLNLVFVICQYVFRENICPQQISVHLFMVFFQRGLGSSKLGYQYIPGQLYLFF